MAQLTDKFWAVEVPDDASNFKLEDHKVRNVFDERDDKRLVWDSPAITHRFLIMPPGTWQYLFTTKDCTYADAASIVDYVSGRFKNYENGVWFLTPFESLQSLLTSKGCDINKNWAIIQKQNDNAAP